MGRLQLVGDFLGRAAVDPRLVVEGVVADLESGRSQALHLLAIGPKGSILAHHEHSEGYSSGGGQLEYVGDDDIEI